MIILGINAYHGDSAAAIVKDGKVINTIEEKHSADLIKSFKRLYIVISEQKWMPW